MAAVSDEGVEPSAFTRALDERPVEAELGGGAEAIFSAVEPRPKALTSIGSGKAPIRSTTFGDHHHAGEATATISSRGSAPPPLIRARPGPDLVGTVDGQVEFGHLVQGGEADAAETRTGEIGGAPSRHADHVEAGGDLRAEAVS